MPPHAVRREVQVVDTAKIDAVFARFCYPAGSTFDKINDVIESIQDAIIRKTPHSYAVHPSANEAFSHLLECFQYRDAIRIARVEIQRIGFVGAETVDYPKLPRDNARILVILPDPYRPRFGFTWYFQGKPVNMMVTRPTLACLASPVSELSISSGDTIAKGRLHMKASKAIVLSFVVDCLNDVIMHDFGDAVVDKVMPDGNFDKLDDLAKQGKLPKSVASLLSGEQTDSDLAAAAAEVAETATAKKKRKKAAKAGAD